MGVPPAVLPPHSPPCISPHLCAAYSITAPLSSLYISPPVCSLQYYRPTLLPVYLPTCVQPTVLLPHTPPCISPHLCAAYSITAPHSSLYISPPVCRLQYYRPTLLPVYLPTCVPPAVLP